MQRYVSVKRSCYTLLPEQDTYLRTFLISEFFSREVACQSQNMLFVDDVLKTTLHVFVCVSGEVHRNNLWTDFTLKISSLLRNIMLSGMILVMIFGWGNSGLLYRVALRPTVLGKSQSFSQNFAVDTQQASVLVSIVMVSSQHWIPRSGFLFLSWVSPLVAFFRFEDQVFQRHASPTSGSQYQLFMRIYRHAMS